MPAKKNTIVQLEPVPITASCDCVIMFRESPPIPGDEILCFTHGPVVVVKSARRRNVGRSVSNTVRRD